ncbi:FAD-dependent monooxygenase [Tenacibaculum aiptasiae]|uniref:NAD(P)/FAD-dependent oxidoreductase n=1 Tax=Tenacibaculum aiptasiae TaxID=426481 RepID=UPI003B5A9E18
MNKTTINTEVVIVGSGIAGLILSNLLKEKKINHVVLDRVEKRKLLEIPETLPPSALVLLESLNLLELFKKSSSKTFGYHSIWNSEALTTNNFFNHNPYKYGLKLNKKEILKDLKKLVTDQIIQFNNLIKINRSDENVRLKIEHKDCQYTINSQIIVDATGRNRAVLKQIGITSKQFDNQIALSCHLPYYKHPKLMHEVYVETFEHGWGIVSSLNKDINGITLYTKKESPLLPQLKKYQNWKKLLSNTKLLKDFLSDNPNSKIIGGEANSSRASKIAGTNWLAIGDAAIAFDPLSSHGVSNAIYCANIASRAIESYTTNHSTTSFQNYENTLSLLFNEYLKQKNKLYNKEKNLIKI